MNAEPKRQPPRLGIPSQFLDNIGPRPDQFPADTIEYHDAPWNAEWALALARGIARLRDTGVPERTEPAE